MSDSAAAVREFDRHERDRWRGRASAYEASLGALCAFTAPLVLDAAGVAAGWRVIDAGTGPGTLARLAAERGALVVALDGERGMLELARIHLASAVFCEAVLPRFPVRGGWADAAVANFVINHLGDPPAGMAEVVRVVRSGGKVAVTVWPSPPPALQRLWGEAFDAAGVTRPEGLPRVPEDRNFARTPRGITDLLCGSGLRDVDCETITWSHRTDLESWWSGPAGGIGTLGVLMRGQPAETVAAIRREYQRLANAYLNSDGTLALPTAALLAVGTVP